MGNCLAQSGQVLGIFLALNRQISADFGYRLDQIKRFCQNPEKRPKLLIHRDFLAFFARCCLDQSKHRPPRQRGHWVPPGLPRRNSVVRIVSKTVRLTCWTTFHGRENLPWNACLWFYERLHDKAQWPGPPFAFDFIFVSADLAGRVQAVRVEPLSQASDHQPVLLVLS